MNKVIFTQKGLSVSVLAFRISSRSFLALGKIVEAIIPNQPALDRAVQVAKESVKGDKLSASLAVGVVLTQEVTLALFSWREVRQ